MKLRGVMKLLSKTIILLALLVQSSFANDVIKKMKELKLIHFAQLGSENDEFFAYVVENKADHQFKVFDKKDNEVISDSFPILTDGFRNLTMIDIGDEDSPYLAVVTQRGIHGENLRLYSLPKKKLIKSFASTLPVIWRTYEDHLSVEVAGPKKSDGNEEREVIEYPATKK